MKHYFFPLLLLLSIAAMLPLQARFLQADPARQYVNSYSYTRNYPIQFADPTGMFAEHYLQTTDKSGNLQFKFMFDDGVDDGRILVAKDNQFKINLEPGSWLPNVQRDYQEQWFTQNDLLWMTRTISSEVGFRTTNMYEMDAIGEIIMNRYNKQYKLSSATLNDGFTIEDIVRSDKQFSEISKKNTFLLDYPNRLTTDVFNRSGWNRNTQSAFRALTGQSLAGLPDNYCHFYSPCGFQEEPMTKAWIKEAHQKNLVLTHPFIHYERFLFIRDLR